MASLRRRPVGCTTSGGRIGIGSWGCLDSRGESCGEVSGVLDPENGHLTTFSSEPDTRGEMERADNRVGSSASPIQCSLNDLDRKRTFVRDSSMFQCPAPLYSAWVERQPGRVLPSMYFTLRHLMP